jgi:hypothetical protein
VRGGAAAAAAAAAAAIPRDPVEISCEAREKYKHLDKFKLGTFFPWAATKGGRGRADVSLSLSARLQYLLNSTHATLPIPDVPPPSDATFVHPAPPQLSSIRVATRQPLFYNA